MLTECRGGEFSSSRTRVQACLEITSRCLMVHQLPFPHCVLGTDSTTRNEGETPIECIAEQESQGIIFLAGCEWEHYQYLLIKPLLERRSC